MGKFINTQHRETIDSLVDGLHDKLDNPYYIFQEESPTVVTFYNVNTKHTTLDEALKIEQSRTGFESPLRFDKINNFVIYGGLGKLQVVLRNGEEGIDMESVEVEHLILPNTIDPIPNSYYCINYLGTDHLFKIIECHPDTLENGSNFFRIVCSYYGKDTSTIEDQVINEYDFLINNVGTNFNTIIRHSEYNFIDTIEDSITQLKDYYKVLFYNRRVDSFIFGEMAARFYDKYLIKFLIDNKILSGATEYLFITQQISISNYIDIEYRNTFFYNLIRRNKDFGTVKTGAHGIVVEEPLSTLSTRVEKYHSLEYIYETNIDDPSVIKLPISELTKKINTNIYDNTIDDIIVAYFNDTDINDSMINAIETLDYKYSKELFYKIPCIIYCLESYCKTLLSKPKTYK